MRNPGVVDNRGVQSPTWDDAVWRRAAIVGRWEAYEDGVTDGHLMAQRDVTNLGEVMSPPTASLLLELAPLNTLRTWLRSCPGTFAKDMALGLLESAVLSFDSQDWDRLADAVVSWGATLQIEADRPLARRLRRQLQTTPHGNPA